MAETDISNEELRAAAWHDGEAIPVFLTPSIVSELNGALGDVLLRATGRAEARADLREWFQGRKTAPPNVFSSFPPFRRGAQMSPVACRPGLLRKLEDAGRKLGRYGIVERVECEGYQLCLRFVHRNDPDGVSVIGFIARRGAGAEELLRKAYDEFLGTILVLSDGENVYVAVPRMRNGVLEAASLEPHDVYEVRRVADVDALLSGIVGAAEIEDYRVSEREMLRVARRAAGRSVAVAEC